MIKTDQIRVTGKIIGVLRDSTGKIKERFEMSNLVVDLGREMINDALRTGTITPLSWLGIGWSEPDSEPADPAAGDINFPATWVGAQQNRKLATITKVSPTVFTLTQTWATGEPSTTPTWPKPIRAIGAFTAPGTGNNEIFSWSKRAPINKAAGDTLQFTYVFTIG